MAELSTATAIAVPTIKYYLREGLLPAGERTSANQASYDDSHVARVRLIRALIEVGGLPVATAKSVLAAIDTPDMPLSWIFGAAQYAISDASLYDPIDGETAGARKTTAAIERMHWHVSDDNPGRYGAARVLDTYDQVGHPELSEIWDGYANGSELIARADLEAVGRQSRVEAMSETVVVGTVLGDALLSSLRRMAQEHVSGQLFPNPAPNAATNPAPNAATNPALRSDL